ncbi:MAG: hypothetical protein CFE44_26800, partial [Burkholderiales bacterium PBB4]
MRCGAALRELSASWVRARILNAGDEPMIFGDGLGVPFTGPDLKAWMIDLLNEPLWVLQGRQDDGWTAS